MTAPPSLTLPAPLAEFESSYPDLVRYLSRHGGQGEQARDLAHDVWLRLVDSSANAPRQARAYLFGAARNLAIDHLRRDRHHAELLADAAVRQAADSPDVAEQVGHRQALEAVTRALMALPERTRDVFLAHRLDGTGQDELALRHGVTRSTIERDIQRAQHQVFTAMVRWHGSPPAGHTGRRRSLATLLGVAGAALASPWLWHAWQARVPQWQQALAAPPGRIVRHTLPDGSVLVLDAGSLAQAAWYGHRRALTLLRGGAFLDVAHDASRPFEVQAGTSRITVLGTRFAVELDGDPARVGVQVAVERGRVRVQPATGPAHELGAGEALRIAADGSAALAAQATQGTVAPWRDGWLSFNRTPLAEAARRIGRYRSRPLRVAPEVGALPVSGEVRIAHADEWVHLLPRLLPVQVRGEPDGSLTVLPR